MRFVPGDKVDWADNEYKARMIKGCGPGPFIIRGVEDDLEADEGGHCQHLSIMKEVNGKMYCWASYKNAWIDNGPIIDPREGFLMFVAAPPVFSNLHFKKV